MQKVLTPASVCIVVGSLMGAMLNLMMKHAPEGTFLAFEPLPEYYERLQAAFDCAKVHLYNLALSDSAGSSPFNYVITNPGYSGLRKRRYDRPKEDDMQLEVRTDRLDNILEKEGIGKVSFIKIDVEGAEYLVMKGAEHCLKTSRPIIVFEHGPGGSDCYGIRPEDVFDLLNVGCGLDISLLPDFLRDEPPLDSSAFLDQYYGGRNYYFIAHEPV